MRNIEAGKIPLPKYLASAEPVIPSNGVSTLNRAFPAGQKSAMPLAFCNIFCVKLWARQRAIQQTLKAFMSATDVRACAPAEASKERAGEEEGHSLDRGGAQVVLAGPLQVWQGRLAQHISELCGFQDSHTGQITSGYLSHYNLAQGLQVVSLQPMMLLSLCHARTPKSVITT